MALALGFSAERHWTEERENTLIAFFSKHSCLWNQRSEGYKNRALRWKTLERLRIILCAQPPPAPLSVEDIKSKFKNLRTTFQRQYKMVRASRSCGADNPFVPQWRHYQQLMFLRGCWEQDDPSDEPPPSPLAVAQEASSAPLTSQSQTFSFLPTPCPAPPSSCTPSSVTIKCHWTEERECELISFYSEHSCLWNIKSENHSNRQLRQRLLEALKNQLSDGSVSFSVEDIKYKFKNLRTVFNREHKAVQASLASDKPYVSKWKHYLQLLFLSEACEVDHTSEQLLLLSYQDDKDGEQQGPQTSSFSGSNTLRLQGSAHSDSNPNEKLALESLPSASPGGEMRPHPPPPLQPDSPQDTKSSAVVSGCGGEQPAESRCLWSDAKVLKLISFYSEHSCLWNHRSDGYKNRPLRQNLLETLSRVLSDGETVSVEDIKTKFRNLRTIFQREHKAVSFNKTCGSGDFYLPKWKYYTDLMFLCDSCDEDELPENGPLHRTEPGSPSQTPAPSAAQHSPSPTPTSADPGHVSGHKRGSRHLTSTDSEVVEFLRTFCQNQTPSPHAGFLRYVEECLNETPPNNVKTMKKRIIETIHSVLDQV